MAIPMPAGYRHLALDDVASTNSECLEAARRGQEGNLWITARRQLAGRGSRGRHWVSEPGNLYASLLLENAAPPAALPQLTFVASLAICDALTESGLEASTVRLKWPNDVLVRGAKVSGILLESHGLGRRSIAIAGMGINIEHHPGDTLHRATDLRREGVETSCEQLFALLAGAMAARLEQWQGGANARQILDAWRGRAVEQGAAVRVVLPARAGREAETLHGVDAGVGDDGQLLLDCGEAGIRHIAAGDIFFD